MNARLFLLLVVIVVVLVVVFMYRSNQTNTNNDVSSGLSETTATSDTFSFIDLDTSRDVTEIESLRLPLSGSAPTENVKHSIPIDEIRRGCFRQDCIPSVDDPQFITISEADDILPEDSIGIGLIYKDEVRFYPFNMLVTREIVNDTIAGYPILATYCPLCGTGIVFEREVNGKTHEFGVSGMLWQSNLLMYNRADSLDDRNLWSQVLGEAVVGNDTGTKLSIIPSNVVRYTDWRTEYPSTLILNTGRIGDPYDGEYYRVAQNFDPNFNEVDSPLDPSAYVHGVEIDGVFKAYPDSELMVGTIDDMVGDTAIVIKRTRIGEISITDTAGNVVPVVTGFWFSWVSAHPDTALWLNN